jgi:F-type H+/Na+-transporting ATPase subunit beta
MVREIGFVKSIKGDIAEIEFPFGEVLTGEILILKDDPKVRFEVQGASKENLFFCLIFGKSEKLIRGAPVQRTREKLKIPVGKELLGRAINLFGEPLDGLGKIETQKNAK